MSETNLLDEEIKMLVRASRNERFRFIIIQYNHFSLIEKVKKKLLETYSERKSCTINLNKIDQKDFIQDILNCKTGFVFIEEFENLLKEDYRSLAIGFNQRRDKFSEYPITIIAFLPTSEKYLQECQTIMPDIFSLVNPIIQLKQESSLALENAKISELKDFRFKNSTDAKWQIEQIENRLKTLEKVPENFALKFNFIGTLVEAYIFLGDFKAALKIISDFLNSTESKNLTLAQYAHLQNGIAVIYSNLGNYKKALQFYLKALNLNISDSNKIIELHTNYSNIGECYRNLKKPQKALQYGLLALENLESLKDKTHLKFNHVYNNLALIYEDLKNYSKAIEFYQKDLTYLQQTFHEFHPDIAISYNNIGGLHSRNKNFEDAMAFSEKALAIRLQIYGSNHPAVANSYNNIGALYSFMMNKQKARSYYEMAHKILLNTVGENHPETKQVKENIKLLQ